ncbi:MAG: lipid II flippase MurJ [Minwuia sp.]|nr:lipid II flippase MurJ [Minwuia sp.]
MLAGVLKSGAAVALALLIGRLLGFGREATIAASFGLGREADIAVFLVGLPDFLINVLGAGGVTAVLVVVFRQRAAEASRLLFQASVAIFCMVGLLALGLVLVRAGLVDLLAPGFDAITRQRTIDLLPLVILAAPVAAINAVTIAWLQADDRFFLSAIGTAVINAVLIAALLIDGHGGAVVWLAVAVFGGVLLRWLIQMAAIGQRALGGISFRPWLVDRRMIVDMAQTSAAESIVYFYPFALRAFATLFGIGALASVNFATRLVLLPLGVVITTLTIILLPRLANLAPGGETADRGAFLSMVRQGQTWILILSGMAVVALFLSRDLITRLVFGWGDISAAELSVIAWLTAIYALSLIPLGLNVFIRRVLNVMGDTRSPMIGEVLGFAAFLLAAFAVEALQGELADLILAAVFGAFVSSGYLLVMVARRDVPLPSMLLQPATWGTTLLAMLATGIPLVLEQTLIDGGAVTGLGALAVGGLLGLTVAIVVNRDARTAVSGLRRRT